MKVKRIIIVLMILILFVSTSCSKKDDLEIDGEREIEKDEEEIELLEEQEGVPSPISGLYALEEKINRRPFAIMFDNHPRARWQAGLSQAEIVYEFMVEAPYTRYMGIYLINDPKSIGPIRSSRPYFITTLLEYDAVYVRVGGSSQAKQDVIKLKIADIDGLSSSNKVLWKDTKVNKRAPHNTYTNMEVLRKTQEERGFKLIGEIGRAHV